jgi:hypothetical protein
MKKQFLLLVTLAFTATVTAQTKAGFDDITLSNNSFKNGSGAAVSGKFNSGNVEFPNTYQSNYGGFWSDGWAYSNIKNDTNGSYENLYAAYANSGVNSSSNYAIGQQGCIIRTKGVDAGDTVKGLYVTNGTYPALTVKNGNAFSKKFGGVNGTDADFFVLIIKAWKNGIKSADSVNFYLADYRSDSSAFDYIVKDWAWVDLTKLGAVDSLEFTMNSSDNGQFGINTPLFFCVDDVVTKNDTADFENLNLAANKFWSKPNTSIRTNYQSGNAIFPSRYSISGFGDYWSGDFAISNKTDVQLDSGVIGYNKIYNAVVSNGADSTENYAVAQQGARIILTGNAAGKQVEGVYVTNSNYAYLSMKWGDGFARKFNDTDYFRLNIIGFKNGASTDTVLFYLAQNGNIVNTWTWVDLKPLGNVDSVIFSLSSSDVGQFGMNTPGFFAIDEFTTRDAFVGLSTLKNNLNASVFPNPTNGKLNVSVSAKTSTIEVKVYNMMGKLMLKQNTFNNSWIDLSNLPHGVYFIRIEDGNDLTTVRVIKH